jgi:hypothetical protein
MMKSVLFSDYDVQLGEVLPFLDPARFRYAVADFQNPALAMAEFDCIVPFQLKDYFDLRRERSLAGHGAASLIIISHHDAKCALS